MKELSTRERKTKENDLFAQALKVDLFITLLFVVLSIFVSVLAGSYILRNNPGMIISILLGLICGSLVSVSLVTLVDATMEYINK